MTAKLNDDTIRYINSNTLNELQKQHHKLENFAKGGLIHNIGAQIANIFSILWEARPSGPLKIKDLKNITFIWTDKKIIKHLNEEISLIKQIKSNYKDKNIIKFALIIKNTAEICLSNNKTRFHELETTRDEINSTISALGKEKISSPPKETAQKQTVQSDAPQSHIQQSSSQETEQSNPTKLSKPISDPTPSSSLITITALNSLEQQKLPDPEIPDPEITVTALEENPLPYEVQGEPQKTEEPAKITKATVIKKEDTGGFKWSSLGKVTMLLGLFLGGGAGAFYLNRRPDLPTNGDPETISLKHTIVDITPPSFPTSWATPPTTQLPTPTSLTPTPSNSLSPQEMRPSPAPPPPPLTYSTSPEMRPSPLPSGTPSFSSAMTIYPPQPTPQPTTPLAPPTTPRPTIWTDQVPQSLITPPTTDTASATSLTSMHNELFPPLPSFASFPIGTKLPGIATSLPPDVGASLTSSPTPPAVTKEIAKYFYNQHQLSTRVRNPGTTKMEAGHRTRGPRETNSSNLPGITQIALGIAAFAYANFGWQPSQPSRSTLIVQGKDFVKNNQLEAALDSFIEAKDLDSVLEVGEIFLENKNYAKALECYKKAQEQGIKIPRIEFLHLGVIFEENGELSHALECNYLASTPVEDSEVRAARGMFKDANNKFLKLADKIMESKNIPGLIAMAKMYKESKPNDITTPEMAYDEAFLEVSSNQNLHLDNNMSQALLELGDHYFELGDEESLIKAVTCYKKSQKENISNLAVLNCYKTASDMKNNIYIPPGSWVSLGNDFLKNKELGSALECFYRAQIPFSENETQSIVQGRKEAKASYDNCLLIIGLNEDPRGYITYGKINFSNELIENTFNCYQLAYEAAVVRDDPLSNEDKEVLLELGEHYALKGDLGTAYICYNRAQNKQKLAELGNDILDNQNATFDDFSLAKRCTEESQSSELLAKFKTTIDQRSKKMLEDLEDYDIDESELLKKAVGSEAAIREAGQYSIWVGDGHRLAKVADYLMQVFSTNSNLQQSEKNNMRALAIEYYVKGAELKDPYSIATLASIESETIKDLDLSSKFLELFGNKDLNQAEKLTAQRDTYDRASKLQSARNFYERALTKDPSNISLMEKLASVYNRIGKFNEQLGMYLQAATTTNQPEKAKQLIQQAEIVLKNSMTKQLSPQLEKLNQLKSKYKLS